MATIDSGQDWMVNRENQ